ncbi:MAG: DegT/DnrJ/EryC1/StrS family aminotransferase, partial [Saprospiraceae bacterium]
FKPEEITPVNVGKVNILRNNFMDYLQQKGISTRPGTHAVHMLGYYKNKYNITQKDYPNAMIADMCSIAFPLFPSMKDEEFNYIKDNIMNYKPEIN